MEEIWKNIPDYEGYYQASSLGRIRSLDRVSIRITNGKKQLLPKKGTVLSSQIEGSGYHQVNIQIQGFIKKHKKVHRLVAIAFIPNPENKSQVNHKDGNKNNNSLENLEWATSHENIQHAYRAGLKIPQQTGKSGSLHHMSKAVVSIKQTAIVEHGSIEECARYFKVTRNSVLGSIKNGYMCKGNNIYYL